LFERNKASVHDLDIETTVLGVLLIRDPHHGIVLTVRELGAWEGGGVGWGGWRGKRRVEAGGEGSKMKYGSIMERAPAVGGEEGEEGKEGEEGGEGRGSKMESGIVDRSPMPTPFTH